MLTKHRRLEVVVLGLSITSSWGNGHATTYRGLLRALWELGHDVLFLERDLPWYADNRDLPSPEFVRAELYASAADLKQRYAAEVRDADLVIVGSYVPDGIEIGEWVVRTARGVRAFYDIDTPETLGQLEAAKSDYICKRLIPRYDLYLSFSGGPALELLEREYHAQRARALYCSADPSVYGPDQAETHWELGYMGTYSEDRQPGLERLLLAAARIDRESRFAVVGPQYPEGVDWPANVARIPHLAPDQHRTFYNRQRFTLNLTRTRMRELGYSPSVRLFEAAACGTPLISDAWPGLESLFTPNREILIAESTRDTLEYLHTITDEERLTIGARARERVLAQHTSQSRAQQLLDYVAEVRGRPLQARARA
jgi:spore maturation protein CgeB